MNRSSCAYIWESRSPCLPALRRTAAAALWREDIRQGVPERPLAVAASLAGKQRRHRPAESAALEFGLVVRPCDPKIHVEGEQYVVLVAPQRRRPVVVEVLLLVDIEDARRRARHDQDGVAAVGARIVSVTSPTTAYSISLGMRGHCRCAVLRLVGSRAFGDDLEGLVR